MRIVLREVLFWEPASQRTRRQSEQISMKDRLLVMAVSVAIMASAMVASPPLSLAQAPATWPGIITSVSGSATISTKGMSPGGEIWAAWYSLPPGKVVVESASAETNAAKWAYVEMALDGSAVVTGAATPMCDFLRAGGSWAGGAERITDPGDVEVCNYAILPGSRTENRGSKPYIFAGLAVGGPWAAGMEDETDLYRKAEGLAQTARVAPSQFGEVEKEILEAGAMTVAIRNVTMPPRARIVTTDHYPTLRMVESGQLTLSTIPESAKAAAPKTLVAFEITEWAPANAEKQIVLSNSGDQPVQFVEWTVAPAPGVKP